MSAPREDWFAILDAIRSGDEVALMRLTSLVASILQRLGGYRHGDSLEDLIQEVVVRLVESHQRDAIRDRGAFVGYAWAIARNRLFDWIKRRERAGTEAETEPDELPGSAPGLPADRDPDTLFDLERALKAIPGDERAVLQAVYMEGYSYAEAAELLGLSLGTLKRRQTRGLRLLREKMQVGGQLA